MPIHQFIPLAAPHDAILLTVTRFPAGNIKIEYTGPSLAALLAAGCITDQILEHFTAHPRKHLGPHPRKGEYHCRCFRNQRRGVTIERRFLDMDLVLQMPGVHGDMIKDPENTPWHQ